MDDEKEESKILNAVMILVRRTIDIVITIFGALLVVFNMPIPFPI